MIGRYRKKVRGRLYFIGVPRRHLRAAAISDDRANQILAEVMQLLVGSQLTPIQEYLLDERDPTLVAKFNAALADWYHGSGDKVRQLLCSEGSPRSRKEPKAKRPKVTSTPLWVGRHSEEFDKRGLGWLGTNGFDDDFPLWFPGVLSLQQREVEILMLHGVN